MRAPLVLILLALPAAVAAQERQFELTPYIGYQYGGSFETDEPGFGRVDFDVDESSVLGLGFSIPVSRSLAVELLYFAQTADFSADGGFLGPSTPLGEVDLDHYHVGVVWQSVRGQVRPYASLTGGLARVEARAGGSGADNEISISLGGGVKLLFTDHFGIRLDGRLFVTDLGDEPRYCCYDCCHEGNDLAQGQVAAGLILAF